MKTNPTLSKFLRRDYRDFEDQYIAEWMKESRMSADHIQLAVNLMHLTIKQEAHSAFVPMIGKRRREDIARLLADG